MASKLAEEMLSNPLEIVTRLSRAELLLLEEFITAGANKYIIKKARKSEYMLQKMGLVLTYDDTANGKWHILMPNEVHISLSSIAAPFISMAKEGKKTPSAKELRMHSMMTSLLGHSNFTISGNTVTIHHDN